MNKSLQLTLCDTQGKLFELSGERGYDSESFIKAFMTTDNVNIYSSFNVVLYNFFVSNIFHSGI